MPEMARFTIMAMDAWTFIPFMMIMLLAGLQAIPKDIQEAAQGRRREWLANFWEVTFPLMLPVSITAILIRIIFKLKLADIIINVTAGGPGGATDSVTSFIFREYRDRSNVGYGTLLAMVYLVLIVIAITIFMKLVSTLDEADTDMTETATRQIFHDHEADRAFRPKWFWAGSPSTVLIFWTVHLPRSDLLDDHHLLQGRADVMQGNLVPWVGLPAEGLGALAGPVAETDHRESTVREEFLKRFWNSAVVSVGASALAVVLGSSPPTGSRGSTTASASCATTTSRSSSSAS
jgi:ABC-type Fe3+ transport system permease subunit